MAEERLDTRALNRATLARQLLLDRQRLAPLAAVEHLVGMQAQCPNSPYVGLWSRLTDFDPDVLGGLIAGREAVRAPLMRCTLHLASAADCLALRPVVQAVFERTYRATSEFARQVADEDLDAVRAAGEALLAARPRTRAELAPLLAERWPGRDQDALVYAVTYLAPLVQVPPRGVWGATGPSAWAPVESWLGREVAADPAPDRAVVRYLAAFGPAGVMDAQQWSGLTRLREVFERLRPELRTFRDDAGRELFDLPDAPRPDPDTPAPPRFLPEYDNAQFSHADRRRIVPDGRRPPLFGGNGGVLGTVLVDGFLAGTWRLDVAAGETATVTVAPYEPLSAPDLDEVTEEGLRLAAFAAPGATTSDVRVA